MAQASRLRVNRASRPVALHPFGGTPPRLAGETPALRSGPQPCDLLEVLRRANDPSKPHTIKEGYYSFELLHVATVLHLAAKEFLTFDVKQAKLAATACLAVKPWPTPSTPTKEQE